MPDQSNAPRVGEPQGSTGLPLSLTVPAVIVDAIRGGAYAELSGAAEELDVALWSSEREAHPEESIVQLERLDAARLLLEALGWSTTVPQVDVRLDLSKAHRAFKSVLDAALMFAEDDLHEVEKRNAELTASGHAPKRDATTEQFDALRDFAASVCDWPDMSGAKDGGAR